MLDRLRFFLRARDPVVREWEWYARHHEREQKGRPLGEEWNASDVIGVAVPADEIVSHIDRTVLEPHLGRVDTLLEIGAGGGRFTVPLVPRARHLIAADTSPMMIRLLERRFREHSNVSTLLLPGSDLHSLAADSVDAVFSYDVFVHLSPWTIHLYLEEIRRVLRPGGRAILHHANLHSELGWRRFARDAERVRSGRPASARFTPMTPELMATLAAHAGLDVRASVTAAVPRDCITVLGRPETP